LRGGVDDLVTTLFPAECRVCDRPLVRASRVPVCEGCLEAAAKPQAGALCRVCGEALGWESEQALRQFGEGWGGDGRLCVPCRRIPPEFARAVAPGVYEGELRELIHLLKYERMRGLAKPLGRMLAGAIEQMEDEIDAAGADWAVVAVPVFATKAKERGYNHAEVLADVATKELRERRPEWKLKAEHGALRRVRETASQFELTPRARRENLRGAFAVTEGWDLVGRYVLLVDDIYTTGATARTCAAVLRRAGAAGVLVATVARAQVEAVAMWDGGRTGAERRLA